MNLNAGFLAIQPTPDLYNVIGNSYEIISRIQNQIDISRDRAMKEKEHARSQGVELTGNALLRYAFDVDRANNLKHDRDRRLNIIKGTTAELKRRGLYAPK